MKLIRDSNNLKPDFFVITGDGGTEYSILRGLCEKFRNSNKILLFPKKVILKQTGLQGLNAIKYIPKDFKIFKIIYTVDRDCFKKDIKNTRLNIKSNQEFDIIVEYLKTIGVKVSNIEPIEKACLINCSFSNYNIKLYCIILGMEVCLEEEIVILLKNKYNIDIDTSGSKNKEWKLKVKIEIEKNLKQIGKTKQDIIKDAGTKYLKEAFPNLYALFKLIEEEI